MGAAVSTRVHGTQYCSILLSVNLQIISKTSNKMADTEPTPVEEVQVEPVENKEVAEATTEETEATSTEAAGEETPAATEETEADPATTETEAVSEEAPAEETAAE